AVDRSKKGRSGSISRFRTVSTKARGIEDAVAAPHHKFGQQLISESEPRSEVPKVGIVQSPVGGSGENEFAQITLANGGADRIDRTVIEIRLPVVTFTQGNQLRVSSDRYIPVPPVLDAPNIKAATGDPVFAVTSWGFGPAVNPPLLKPNVVGVMRPPFSSTATAMYPKDSE